ncbi:metal ABC transporter ATPase [Burkholderia anthina]|uniref:metal ABC transporter ATPase n=1 Tax=Burkholderia anthina TaxID=179879 RepID=UPI001AA0AD39|nr:metal ABC transporter ATPase [Burkholderia anthina]QTD94325.1 metal ABC transporter ATPase [Burkholderia anthina]
MGVGMQIVYVGCTGFAALEAEAGAQLVRLERFRARLGDCRLAIEARTSADGGRIYDVRLDLVMYGCAPASLPCCSGDDVTEAMCCAFAQAERMLDAWQAGDIEALALHGAATGGASR